MSNQAPKPSPRDMPGRIPPSPYEKTGNQMYYYVQRYSVVTGRWLTIGDEYRTMEAAVQYATATEGRARYPATEVRIVVYPDSAHSLDDRMVN